MRILLITVVCLLFGGCSFYRVVHEETPIGPPYKDEEGDMIQPAHYRTAIVQMVPPGGKELSSGQANISAQSGEDIKWRIKIGADLQTDMSGTAALIDSLIGRLTALAGQLALAQTMVHAPAETGPPTPEIVIRPRVPTPPPDDDILNR